ncbi:MAG: hypothetical protein ACR2NN_29335 [Bryobacteraceae bacterium]
MDRVDSAALEISPESRQAISGRILTLKAAQSTLVCVLADGRQCAVSLLMAGHIRRGDELLCAEMAETVAAESWVRKPSARRADVCVAKAGHSAIPKPDKKQGMFVRVEVVGGCLGIAAIHVPCSVIRDYFFVVDRDSGWEQQPSFYSLLRLPNSASFKELRLAFRMRRMGLKRERSSVLEQTTLERAYNILAHPELRGLYDELREDPAVPVPFPYSGFGTLLVEGEPAKEGGVFFARRILAFLPDRQKRTFTVPLRRFDFFADYAILRDRKREVPIDQDLLDIGWDPSWNQWRNLISGDIQITAEFVRTVRYRKRAGEWHLTEWELALPSRTELVKPEGLDQAVAKAKYMHTRFGRHSDAIGRLRDLVEKQPVEREDLRRMCWDLGLPGDFDVSEIAWHAEYESYYYEQLAHRSRSVYLFRDEYIFDLEKAIVAEIPCAGHATYVFAKSVAMAQFVERYAATTRRDIRANRGNIADELRFTGRVVHGKDKAHWLRELSVRIGELTAMDAGVP